MVDISLPEIPFDVAKMSSLETLVIALLAIELICIAYYFTKRYSKNLSFYLALIFSLFVICIYFSIYSFVNFQLKFTKHQILEIRANKFAEIIGTRVDNTYRINKFFRDRYENLGVVVNQDIKNYITDLEGFQGVVIFDNKEKAIKSYFNNTLNEATRKKYIEYQSFKSTANSQFYLEKIDTEKYVLFLEMPITSPITNNRNIRFFYNPTIFFDINNVNKTQDELTKIEISVNKHIVFSKNTKEKTNTEFLYPFTLDGLNITINVGVSSAFITKFFGILPQIMLATGIATSILLGFMVYLIQRYHLLTTNLKMALKTRSIFLANVSHEIRTPLYGIIGTGSLMEISDLTPQQTKYINIMMLSAHHLLDLVNNLLDSSKIESGSFPIIYEACNIEELCQEQVNMLQYKANEKKIDLEFIYNEDIHKIPLVPVNPLKQIIQNLLSNAIKFTSHGKVTVDVSITSIDETQGKLHIKIIDTGLGIPENKHHLIFQKFSQIQNRLSSENRGTGLGLYLIKTMIEKIDGIIFFESIENEGSTFFVVIPLIFSKHDKI